MSLYLISWLKFVYLYHLAICYFQYWTSNLCLHAVYAKNVDLAYQTYIIWTNYWSQYCDWLWNWFWLFFDNHQHMENAYPGSNILVVTLTNGESKRIEAQSDQETLREAMEVLRNMFGHDIPDATEILVPRWWNNRFQRGSYSNYPIYINHQLMHDIKVT